MSIFWDSFLPQMEKLWSEDDSNKFKGLMSSFPFERFDVEQTLFQFRDAAGGIIHYHKKARFRKCSCVHNNGKTRPCTFSKSGWNCERPALLLRKNIILENIMVERRRKQNEEKRIDDAVETAKKIATHYLNSEEGRDQVRLVAEQKVNKTNELPGKVIEENTLKEEYSNNEITTTIPSNKNMNLINILAECLPWKKKVEKEIRDAMAEVRSDFISKEIESRRAEAIATNEKLRLVLDAWVGLTVEDVFIGWKNTVAELNQQRIQDAVNQREEEDRCELEHIEKLKMASDEVSLSISLLPLVWIDSHFVI